MGLIGVGGIVGASAWDSFSDDAPDGAVLGITIAGAAVAIVGIVLRLNGEAKRWDAINRYNDDLYREIQRQATQQPPQRGPTRPPPPQ